MHAIFFSDMAAPGQKVFRIREASTLLLTFTF